ncbi:MAG: uracil-DNA glycosylase [Oscillospiraceae bacterium]|nr:uracil-DNA glycosylase [Oscillospiraceae bacterium]
MNYKELGPWAQYIQYPEEAFAALSERVERAYAEDVVYPPREKLFAALELTPPEKTRVVILGQDPYHEPGQAHGLSFSVEPGVAIPKSLVNIYKELQSDLGITPPEHGCLQRWAEQGVLLLNSVLTVEAHRAGSHRDFGWQEFTDRVIAATNSLPQPIAFVLWGNFAMKKAGLIEGKYPRLVLTAPHPSPLSAYRGFFGSKPFSKINEFLIENNTIPIDWKL